MKDDSFKEFVLDQLDSLSGVRCRRMFGGYGMYREEVFFGILYAGRLYLKTNAETKKKFVKAGMKPFKPSAQQTLKNYFEVPPDVLEDEDELTEWAREASSL